MTKSEAEVMQKHAAYWRELLAKGKAIAFGPVAEPKGGWGVGIVAVNDEQELRELQANDPAILLKLGMRYESLPMPAVVHRQ